MNVVYRVEFGSHLYGTNTPASDHDYKSVHLPTANQILLQKVNDSTGHKVKRSEGERNSAEDTDDESYSLQRYLGLLAEGQTVAIDMLFATHDHIITSSHLWQQIWLNRKRLLTKKSAAFVGYCRQQANKYGIKGSRIAAARKAKEFFEKAIETYGPFHKLEHIDHVLTSLEDDHTKARVLKENPVGSGKFEVFFECCNRLVNYNNTFKEAAGIYGRIFEEYGKRARMAESNDGVDFKALSHAVRVANEALELLATGNITFPLPNRAHILAIKLGQIPYKEVGPEIDELLVKVEEAAKVSTLREHPDYEWIDAFIVHNYGKVVMDHVWNKAPVTSG